MNFVVLLGLAFSIGDLDRPGLVREESHLTGWVAPGLAIEINNLLGDVRAEPSPTDELEIIAIKSGRGETEQVAIETVEHKGGLTICAVYPSREPLKPFECVPSHGGGFRVASTFIDHARIRFENGGGGDVRLTDMRVDFIVRVPRGVRLIARTFSGDVEAQRLDRECEAYSVLGDVYIEKLLPAAMRNSRLRSTAGGVYIRN
jgi:hypothetical protein